MNNISLKGIILAGGYGTRLYPLTKGVSKHLLPVYDKPMIYYPLYTLMITGIRDILVISTEKDINRYRTLLGDGESLGIRISYQKQNKPEGIAQAFYIAEDFIGKSNVCLILGDNIFYGTSLGKKIQIAISNLKTGNSTIFGVETNEPNRFGVVKFDSNNEISKIIEKPKKFVSNVIVSGLYFYTNDVIEISKSLVLSERGEYEISDLNNHYLKDKRLKLVQLDNSIFWSDTGTYESLIKSSDYFMKLENKSGSKSACIEEIAYKLNYIDKNELFDLADSMKESQYGKYLLKFISSKS